MIATVLAANSHLPTVDVWEHFYIFSSGCATAVTQMQFLSRIDRISFLFVTTRTSKAGFAKWAI